MPADRKSPKEVLENEEFPDWEGAFLKYPGKEPISVSKTRLWGGTIIDYDKLNSAINENPGKKYNFIHTHPYNSEPEVSKHAPLTVSTKDWETFLKDENAKGMTIAQRDTQTGEVRGSLTVIKTSKTPAYEENEKEIEKAITEYRNDSKDMSKGEEVLEALKTISEKLNLNSKYIPAKGFHISTEDEGEFHFKRGRALEKMVTGIWILLGTFALTFVFLPPSLTGNMIGNENVIIFKGLSFIFLILGLIETLFFIKNAKNNKNF